MSAFGGKADMTVCGCLLSRSLLGVKRTCRFAPHMSAFDPKRTSVPTGTWTLSQCIYAPMRGACVRSLSQTFDWTAGAGQLASEPMSGRYLMIAATVVFCAGALLFAVDYKSFIPTGIQSASMSPD